MSELRGSDRVSKGGSIEMLLFRQGRGIAPPDAYRPTSAEVPEGVFRLLGSVLI